MALDDALIPAGDPQNESEFARGMIVGALPDVVSDEPAVAEIPAPAGSGGYPRSRLIANA